MGLFGKKKETDEPKAQDVKKQEESVTMPTVLPMDEVAEKAASKKLRKAPSKKAPVKAVSSRQAGRQAFRVLRRPLITEKSAALASDSVYVFEVTPSCGKIEVKHAIKELYGVIPRRVNIVAVSGKRVRFGKRHGVRRDWKKAFVYLKKGDTIDVFDAK